MLDFLRTLTAPVFFLKATAKKQVWIPQFTKKNGQVVGGHFAMVHVADDHDHHKVASGAGTYSQKKAHAQLKTEPGFSSLTAEHQAALVMHHATQIQDAESAASRVVKLKAKLMAGQKPSESDWKYFHAAAPEKKAQVTEAVHAAGHGALMDAEYAAWVAKQPPANEAPAEAATPAPAPAKEEPKPAPEAKQEPEKAPEPAPADDDAQLQALLDEYSAHYADQIVHGKVKDELYFVAASKKDLSSWAATYAKGKGAMDGEQLEMFAKDVVPVLKKHGWPKPHSEAMAAAMAEVQKKVMVNDAPALAPKEEPKAEPEAPAGLSMPEFKEGKESKGVKDYYEKLGTKIMDMAAAGDVAGLEAMPNPEKGQSWKGKTPNSKLLIQLHAAALEQAKGGAKPAADGVPLELDNVLASAGSAKEALEHAQQYVKMEGGTPEAYDAAYAALKKHKYTYAVQELMKQQHALADTGPKEGDTKQGKGGTLVLKDGHWVLQEATEKSAWKFLTDSQESGPFIMSEAAEAWQAANPGQDAELSSALVDMGFLHVAKKMGIYVPPGAQQAPAAAPAPAVSQASDEEIEAFAEKLHGALLPEENVNAKSVNAKLQAIHDAFNAGDKQALLAMSFGSNNYAKKAAKLANEALALLGSRHEVAPGQKAGAHPKLKVVSAKVSAAEPAPAAEPPKTPSVPPEFQNNFEVKNFILTMKLAPKHIASLGDDPGEWVAPEDVAGYEALSAADKVKVHEAVAALSPEAKELMGKWLAWHDKKDADAPPDVSGKSLSVQGALAEVQKTIAEGNAAMLEIHMASMEGLAPFKEVYDYAAQQLAKMKGADKQDALISGWKAAIGSGMVPTKEQAAAMEALKGADEGTHWNHENEAFGALTEHLLGSGTINPDDDDANDKVSAHLDKLHQQALGGATPVGLTDSDLAKVNAGGINEDMAEKAKHLAKEGMLAELEAYVAELATNDWPTTSAYAAALATLLAKKQGAEPAAAAEQGPKDGDTKQGADGMLVFKDGRWHKMGDDPKVLKQKADSVPMPKTSGTNTIKVGKAMKELKAAAVSGGAEALAKLLKVDPVAGTVKYKNWADLSYVSQNKYGPACFEMAKYAKQLHDAVAGTKGPSAPADAPAAPAAQKPAAKPAPGGIKTLMVSRILNGGIKNADNWTKTGDQKGSNAGGFYTDSEGQQWYVKTPESDDHVKNELLANKLYAALGIKVPEVQQVKLGGKLSIASKVVDGLKKDPDALKTSDDMLLGFGADAWLGNWDAVGLSYDNAMVDKKGNVYRIDPGGALLYRAQGSAKGAAFGSAVTELDTLRDAAKNPQAASVYGGMTPAQVEESVKQVLLLKDSAIQKLCMAYGPGDKAAREALAAKLIARKADLAAKFPNAAKEAGPKTKVHIAPAPNFKEWKGPGQGLSSKAHINQQNQELADQMQKLAADGKLGELEAMKFQPISYENGAPEGDMQPIAQHKSKHIPLYWNDLLNALKNPIQSIEHMKDAVLETVGGVFGTLISAFDDVKMLTSAASRIGRYAVLGKVDGDPFESWKPAGLSKANGKINSKELYDASMAKYKGLSNIEKEAIKQYTGSSYSSMNNPATGVGSHSNTDYAIAGVDKASVPLKAGTVLSRRFPFHNKADLDKFLSSAEGSILKDFGMVSTSLKSSFWHGQIQLRIVCGEGVKGCFVDRDPTTGGSPISQNPGEDEIILPYGTKFFVRKVHAKGHKFSDEHGDWGKHGGTEYVVEVVALPNS
jgi:hypothetical protein